MSFDNNPRATEADRFIAGKTTESIIRAIVGKTLPDGLTSDAVLVALDERFARKAEKRASREAA